MEPFINLKPGDIILRKTISFGSILLMLRYGARWNHCAIYAGFGKVFEFTKKGFRMRSFDSHYLTEKISVYRVTELSSDEESEFKIIVHILSKLPFALIHLYFPFFPKPNPRRHLMCHTFVEEVYYLLLRKELDMTKLLTKGNKYAKDIGLEVVYDGYGLGG